MKNKIWLDKKLFESLFSLGLAQAFNYLSPIISFPLILKEFGVEKYGIISIAFTLALFFCSLSDFGFNISGIKFIAQSPKTQNKTFSSIFISKLIFSTLILIAFYLLIGFNDSYREYKSVFIFSSGMIIARVFNSDWFFQGKEKMRFIAITNFIANVIYIVGLIVIIKNNLDFTYVALLKSLGLIFSGLISFICAIYFFKIKLILKTVNIIYYIKRGSPVFISTIVSNIFQNTPALLIKALFSYEIVGIYSSIEKIVSFGKQMVMIINQIFHPRLAIYYSENIHNFIRLWKKSSLVSLIATICIYIGLIVAKPSIFNFFLELKSYEFTSILYLIMIILIITYSIINSLGLNGLLVINKTKELALSQLYPLGVYVIFSIVYLSLKIDNIFFIVFLLLLSDLMIILIRIFMFKSYIKQLTRSHIRN